MNTSTARPYRVVTIGDSSVGKTSILNYLTHSEFDPAVTATIAAEFIHLVRTVDSETFEMQIWDTAGAERYRALGPIYYRNAVAALVVFDLTSKSSFESLPSWISSYFASADKTSALCILGNKSDLVSELEVSEADAKQWADEQNYPYFSTSAKDGIGIDDAIRDLAARLHARKIKRPDLQEIDLLKGEPIVDQDVGNSTGCEC
jgi:small GTP-binding protein